MRILKLAVISLVVLFLMLTALSLLIPSHLRISRAINIAAPHERVYASLDELRAWETWNEFIRRSALTRRTWSSPSRGAGAWMKSDQLQVTLTWSSLDSLRADWRQTGGKRFESGFNLMQLHPDSLTVQWWFDFRFRWYPWEKMGGLVYDQQLGPVMEESLTALKRLAENTSH